MSEHLEGGGVVRRDLPRISSGEAFYVSTDGKLSIIKDSQNAFLTTLESEFGEDYLRKTTGLLITETINIGANLIQAAPGAGKLTSYAYIGARFLVRGTGQSIGDAVAGNDDISVSGVLTNGAFNSLKFSKFAPTNKAFANTKLQKLAYDYKHQLTHFDDYFVKSKLNYTAKNGIKQSLIIEPLSAGIQVEKTTVKNIKHKFYQHHNRTYEIPDTNLTANWDDTDKDNFVLLQAKKVPEQDAIETVNKAKQNRGYFATKQQEFKELETIGTKGRKGYQSIIKNGWDVLTLNQRYDPGYTTGERIEAGFEVLVGSAGFLIMGTFEALEEVGRGVAIVGTVVADAGERSLRAVTGGTKVENSKQEKQKIAAQSARAFRNSVKRIEDERTGVVPRGDISSYVKRPLVLPNNYRARTNLASNQLSSPLRIPAANNAGRAAATWRPFAPFINGIAPN